MGKHTPLMLGEGAVKCHLLQSLDLCFNAETRLLRDHVDVESGQSSTSSPLRSCTDSTVVLTFPKYPSAECRHIES
jgi:hypothetical protein